MAVEMVQCANCQTRVVPTANGTCPACRQDTQKPSAPVVAENDHAETQDDAWARYQQSLGGAPVDPALALLEQAEHPYRDLRVDAVARLRSNAGPDVAVADRIREELLPQLAAVVEQINSSHLRDQDRNTSRWQEYARAREASWRFLADALTENDTEKFDRHLELWGNSEMLRIDSAAEKNGSPAASAYRGLQDFRRALVTFTPRLIVTPTLIAANLLVFAAMIATGVHFFEPTAQELRDWGANYGPMTQDGQWWRVATCLFLHFGILHLAFNMWVLWELGLIVERLVGNVGFAVLYLVSGISGSLASLSWHPLVVSAGASGAVFGVAGALLGIIALRRDTIPAAVMGHLWKSMSAFLAYNLIFGIVSSGVDMAAHIGGFLAGFVCGLILSQPLSVAMIARRRARNAIVALGAVCGLLGWASALPDLSSGVPLPSCTSAEVAKVLEQAIRSGPTGDTLKYIDGYRETRYDRDANVRYGQCIVHTQAGDQTVDFIVEWQDVQQGLFRVRIPPVGLPSCSSDQVVQILQQVIRDTPLGQTLKFIDGHREIRYDRDADFRVGQCIAHTDSGDKVVRFIVEWEDAAKGRYRVRIPPADLPTCTSAEVAELLDQVIRDSLVEATLTSIDGYQELRYDREAQVRYGQCVVHTDAGEIPVQFLVAWLDAERGIFQVQTIATEE